MLVLFLLSVLAILIVILVIMLIAKNIKGAIVTDKIVRITAVLTLLSLVIYRVEYNWWFTLEEQVRKDHPAIYQIDASMSSTPFDVYVYTRSSDEHDMDSACEEFKGYFEKMTGYNQVRSHMISIFFYTQKNAPFVRSFSSERSMNNTFDDWQETGN